MVISSNAFGMERKIREVRKDLQGLTYEALKNLEQGVDVMSDEAREIRYAICMNGVIPRELVKAHGIGLTGQPGAVNMKNEVREDLKGKTYEQLEALEKQQEGLDSAFYRKHPNDEWKYSDTEMAEKKRLFREMCDIKRAIEDKVPAGSRSAVSLHSYILFNESQGHFMRESRKYERSNY